MALTIRHYVPGRDDAVRVDLYNRAHAEDEDFVPSTMEDVRGWGESPHWKYFNSFLALLDGVPVGLISVRVHAQRTDGVGSVDGPHVPPDLRRRGIGTALVLAALADLGAQGQVATHASAPDTTEASRFLTSLGFKPVRRFSRMERPLTGLPENFGESADATIVRPELTPDMIRILVDLENETFKEHFNRPPETVEGFKFAERNLAAQGITCYIWAHLFRERRSVFSPTGTTLGKSPNSAGTTPGFGTWAYSSPGGIAVSPKH